MLSSQVSPRPHRRRVLGLIGVLGVLAAAVGTASTTAPAPAAPALHWGPCAPIHGASDETRCATLRVPRDYADPTGPTISITVSKLAARDPAHKRGVLIGNPGGPGGDAIGMFNASALPQAIRDEWDLVAVQPRGLIDSTPVHCATEIPIVDVLLAGRANRDRCERKSPGYTRTITTENTARDIEQVRRALGVRKVSLYGISYGTLLVATYATLFPQHTDRLILDSAVNPDWIWNDVFAEQTAGYKARVIALMTWISQHDAVYHLGSTPLAVYQKWSAQVAKEAGVPPSLAPPPARVADVPPVLKAFARQYLTAVNVTADARTQLANLVASILISDGSQANSRLLSLTREAAPDRNSWPYIALLTTGRYRAVKPDKDTQAVLGNLQDLQAVILCNENQAPTRPELIPAALYANFLTGDIFATPGLYYQSGLGCAGTAPVTRLIPIANKGLAVQPLQIDSVGDPQTPYRGALATHRAMRSHLITVGGGDHGQLGRSNKPLDDAIVAYLRTGHTGVTRVPQAPITTPLIPKVSGARSGGSGAIW
ncbi:MAG: alpha/beta fold hydrolase [Gordonia sp. (in: high G+C Gram-positive bacteria)]